MPEHEWAQGWHYILSLSGDTRHRFGQSPETGDRAYAVRAADDALDAARTVLIVGYRSAPASAGRSATSTVARVPQAPSRMVASAYSRSGTSNAKFISA